jgi:hypothetical protein
MLESVFFVHIKFPDDSVPRFVCAQTPSPNRRSFSREQTNKQAQNENRSANKQTASTTRYGWRRYNNTELNNKAVITSPIH